MHRYRRSSAAENYLYHVIRGECEKHGACNNLFNMAVRVAGQEYHAAHNRLRRLNQSGVVTVIRNGVGLPITITLNHVQLTLEESK